MAENENVLTVNRVDVQRKPFRRRNGRLTTSSVVALLLCGLTACLNTPDGVVSSKHPDKVLFRRAISAVKQERFAIANMTLQILVNTYPDSKYASEAKLMLQDPRMVKCGESWNSAPECDGRRAMQQVQ